MNISVSTIGRFHHFDLARQLLRLEHGLALFTSNPKSRVDTDLRPFAKTHSTFRIPYALGVRLGLGAHLYWLDELLLRDLSKWLARTVDPEWTDVYHGLDGPGPEAGRIVKANGKLWICDRGCSHILTQKEITEEEHKYWGVPPPIGSVARLERCLAEYEEAHAITVPSQFSKRSFVEKGIAPDRVFVCPLGVDLSEFQPGKKSDSVFRIIFVGTICIRKGIGYLLRALEPLVKQGKCELWLVGEIDPAVNKLLNQFKGSFEYKGVCPRKDLWLLYTQASVLVLPSVEDGFGLVQAQAMACGVPVIATTNTGAEDLFTDGIEGFIIPIRSPEAIREKVEWMMTNPSVRDRMAEAALERVKNLGGWDQYGAKVESVYRELVTRHRIQTHQGEPSASNR